MIGKDRFILNGVTIEPVTLVQLIVELTYPNPKKWFRFERKGDEIIVETKMADEENV